MNYGSYEQDKPSGVRHLPPKVRRVVAEGMIKLSKPLVNRLGKPNVGLDGLGATGKDTLVDRFESEFGYTSLNTGNIFRGVTYAALVRCIPNFIERVKSINQYESFPEGRLVAEKLKDALKSDLDTLDFKKMPDEELVSILQSSQIEFKTEKGVKRICIIHNGQELEISQFIREWYVEQHMGAISGIQSARVWADDYQKKILSDRRGMFVQGRDVAFVHPNLPFLMYLYASDPVLKERAEAREKEKLGRDLTPEELFEIRRRIIQRIIDDANRPYGKVLLPHEAHASGKYDLLVNTDNLTREEVAMWATLSLQYVASMQESKSHFKLIQFIWFLFSKHYPQNSLRLTPRKLRRQKQIVG